MQNAAYCFRPACWRRRNFTKIWLIVKLSIVLLTAAFLHVQASGLSQSITLSGKDLDIKQVFTAIKKQTGYVVFYKKGLLEGSRSVTLSVHDMPLADFLAVSLKDQPFTWLVLDKTISLSRKPVPAPPVQSPPVSDKLPPPIPVSGHILDADGKPLIGATISVRNSKASASSTTDGAFTINVNEGDILVISYVGYASQEVKVTAHYLQTIKKSLSIHLQQSNTNLNEVQIIGYGTTTKRLNPGDVTTITAKEIEKNPVYNVFEAIQGKVPGLFIQQVTGQPGGAFTLRLRSSANFTTGAIAPLIVVDGVRYPGGTLPLSTNTSYGTKDFLQGGSGLNYINPNDIASIDVLKDADATAIYGSSGAYGVILISTKKARVGAPSLNANIYTGVSVKGEMPKLLNTEQYVAMRQNALKNDGLTVSSSDLDINGAWPLTRNNDWRKVYMGASAQSTNASLTYSGGAKNTTYMISGSLRNNGNIQRHKGSFGDGSLRFSLNTGTTDDKLNFNLSGSYLSSKDDMVPFDFSQSLVLDAPNAPSAFLPDGSVDWIGAASDPNGPATAANINKTYKNVTNNLLANGTLVYKPVKGVTLRVIIGYNDITGKELMGYPTTTMAPTNTQAAQQTHSVFHYYDQRTLTVSPYAEYSRTLWKKGDLSVKAGGEINDGLTYQDDISGTGFPSDALLTDPAAGTSVTSSFSQTPFRALGFYGIVKYVWDQKYIIDLNGRRDGSTKFGPDNRFGNFGSIAAAWIFSEEQFIKEHLPFLSFGKLRASTGLIGGDAISDYAYLSTYTAISGTYDGKLGLGPNGLANPNLQWEKNRDKEVGLELGLLKDRIFVEGNYYHNETSNQLIARPISGVTGFSSYTLNSDAVIRNSGWEMSLSTTNIKTRDFTWSTRFNISIPTSKLLKLPTLANQNTSYVVGKPLTGLLLYKYAGVDPATGYFSYTNAKGITQDQPSVLTQADKTEFIDLAPKFYGGFQNTVTYRQFSLDFSFSFTKRKGYNSLAQSGYLPGYFDINATTDWLHRWQKPGDKTDIPRVSTANLFSAFNGEMDNFRNSTGAYTDATYARLQNVSFRYHCDRELLRKMHLKDLTVYLQGQNLLTISRFGGLDPENLSATVIPPLRTFTAGINLTL